MQILTCVIVVIFCLLIWRIQFIDFKGAFASAILLIASAIWSEEGFNNTITILIVYLTVIIMTRVKREERKLIYAKVSQKDNPKAIGNVIGKVFLPVLASLMNHPSALLAVLGYGVADSAGSQIGVFSRSKPRLVTNLKQVSPGTNGAISFLGTALGSLLAISIGIVYCVLSSIPLVTGIGWGLFGGFVGNMIDSTLGATVEDKFRLSDWNVNLLSGALTLVLTFTLTELAAN